MSRRCASSPLDAEHRALGAKMVAFGGWEMPLAYPAGTLAEHRACRNDAVVFDVSHLGTVRVEGADALDRLQAALTNDLGKIGPGRAQYTHLLDPTTRTVLDDIIVWWVDDESLRRHAERVEHRPGARRADRRRRTSPATRAIIAVQGREARERLATVSARSGRGRPVPRRAGRRGRAST